MIDSVSIEVVDKLYDRLPFPYRTYRQWQNEDIEPPEPFLAIGSGTAKIRVRKEWNRLGREIYDPADIDRHAVTVAQILGDFGLTAFFVQQAVLDTAWFHVNNPKGVARADEMAACLRSCGVSVDFSTWRGGLIIHNDVDRFLRSFLDYPFILNTYDLEMYSIQAPLAMEISHHQSIHYVSPDPLLVERLKVRLLSEGMLTVREE